MRSYAIPEPLTEEAHQLIVSFVIQDLIKDRGDGKDEQRIQEKLPKRVRLELRRYLCREYEASSVHAYLSSEDVINYARNVAQELTYLPQEELGKWEGKS